ncbi:hypothetical protein K9N68_17685 [Kovacikia minuta CCNUW1]|uniref:hypothetical protein n=1 Tax=Kovacikia minuta TaxID=2931930 RepID=UPI001CCB7D0C|nr:hypothetical protein [Kovacikia minuta]UBF23611.1 hypothetical protein K9N68_17685 [Kovacikia minuta CCNUW1]
MSAPLHLLPGAISEMFAQVSHSGIITLSDRYGLMAAVYDESLTEDERQAIDRILRKVCRRQVTVLNEITIDKALEADKPCR